MKSRQTNVPALAAAKAGFSTATAYRIEADPRLAKAKRRKMALTRSTRSPLREGLTDEAEEDWGR
jgi:hypothetical protein